MEGVEGVVEAVKMNKGERKGKWKTSSFLFFG